MMVAQGSGRIVNLSSISALRPDERGVHYTATKAAVIAATKSGMERNEARFGQYFVEAFAGESADTDKDGHITPVELGAFFQSGS